VKSTEIRNMTAQEVEQTITTLKEKYFNLRSEQVTGRIERPHRMRQIKKDIARCYTILKEKASEQEAIK
jgi:large subunit ribosomal protein L29